MPVIFSFWQLMKSPRRQALQVKSWPPCHPTPTRWPGFQLVTSGPTASTRPAISWPGTRGYWRPGQWPSFTSESLWQMPQASTLILTWLRPGSGMFLSTSSKFPPGLLTWTAFILDIALPHEFRLMEMLMEIERKEIDVRGDGKDSAFSGGTSVSPVQPGGDARLSIRQ